MQPRHLQIAKGSDMRIQAQAPYSPPSYSNRTPTQRQSFAVEAARIAGTASSSDPASIAKQEIMRRYDLHNVSYDEVTGMGRELFDAGAITGEELMDLTAPYFEVFDSKLNRLTDTGARRDYLGDLQKGLEFQKRSAASDRKSIEYLEGVVARFQGLQRQRIL